MTREIIIQIAALLLGCVTLAADSPPVILGAIIELTGKSALAGQQERRGIELALEDLNTGKLRFEAAIEDNASQNAGSVNALNKLAARGDVAAFLAPLRSTQVLAILPPLNYIAIPAVTRSMHETIIKHGSHEIVRIRPDDGVA